MVKKSNSPLKGKPLRNPGQSLDEEIDTLINDKLLMSLLYPSLFWLITAVQFIQEWRPVKHLAIWFAFAALLLSIWAVIRFFRLKKQIVALRLGRDGEKAVGQFLEGLREGGARVFHDVPGEGFNLDHVVISQRGLFVVETKTWSKPFPEARVSLIDGVLRTAGQRPDRDPIAQVRAQMSWLARVLEESTGKRFPVRGALVFPGWFVDPELTRAFDGIWVLEPKALPSFIEREDLVLSTQDVPLAAFHLSRLIRSSVT